MLTNELVTGESDATMTTRSGERSVATPMRSPGSSPTSTRTDVALVIVMAALHERDPIRLDRARSMAVTSRDRQVVEIARAHLDGRRDLVDALARDHLVDHPDSLIVAWIASDAARAQLKEGH